MGDRFRVYVPALIAGFVALVVLTWLWTRPRATVEQELANEVPAAAADAARQPAPREQPPQKSLAEAPPAAPPIADAPAADDPTDAQAPAEEQTSPEDEAQEQIAAAWAKVDMDAVRAAMPDNLYFKMSSPTEDEAVLEARDRERARWNEEYGKVLSGTGTVEEINAYYDLRARVSTDYVEFATYLLDHYRDQLHPRDVQLLELARTLNAKRLEEIPRQIEEAYARKQQQDEARAAWLAGNQELGELQPDNR